MSKKCGINAKNCLSTWQPWATFIRLEEQVGILKRDRERERKRNIPVQQKLEE